MIHQIPSGTGVLRFSLVDRSQGRKEQVKGWERPSCTNPVRDSSRESSVISGLTVQTHIARLQDRGLAGLSSRGNLTGRCPGASSGLAGVDRHQGVWRGPARSGCCCGLAAGRWIPQCWSESAETARRTGGNRADFRRGRRCATRSDRQTVPEIRWMAECPHSHISPSWEPPDPALAICGGSPTLRGRSARSPPGCA